MTKHAGILWLVLDAESSERLKAAVPPKYENEYYHHVTLQFGVAKDAVSGYIGRDVTIEAYAAGHNDKAQAVRVYVQGLPDMYGVPHVTLSTAAGVVPYASVAMLQGTHQEVPIAPPLQLSGTIEFEYLDHIKD